jgi:hypothetical protein
MPGLLTSNKINQLKPETSPSLDFAPAGSLNRLPDCNDTAFDHEL